MPKLIKRKKQQKKKRGIKYECEKCNEAFDPNNCEGCDHYADGFVYRRLSAHVPFWLIDNHLRDMKGVLSTLILFIFRRANFDIRSNHFARCYTSYNEINEYTGISKTHLDKYLRKLEEMDFIKRTKQTYFNNIRWSSSLIITLNILKWQQQDKRKMKIINRKKSANKNH